MVRLVARTRDKLITEQGDSTVSGPYLRGDADAVLAALIAAAVESDNYSAYVGKDPNDGDNSDNGNYVLKTRRGFDWDLVTPDGTIIKVADGAIVP